MRKVIMLMTLFCMSVMVWGQSFTELREKAESGDPEAQYKLGENYFSSATWSESKKDYAKGAKWLKKAAEQGYAEAQFQLGFYYLTGWGVKKNPTKAEAWLLKAAAQQHEKANSHLGFYYQCMGNKSAAIYHYKKSMDCWYEKYGKEDEKSAKELQKLGVVYNPRTQETTLLNSTTATSISSSSSSSSASRSHSTASSSGNKLLNKLRKLAVTQSPRAQETTLHNSTTATRTSSSSISSSSQRNKATSNSGNKLLYKGMYTISGQGYSQTQQSFNNFTTADEIVEIEIYENGIRVGDLWCDYLETTSGGQRKYKGLSSSFGNTTTATYYYVNPTNFNMSKETYMGMDFGMMSQSDWTTYSMSKGECTMPRYNSGGTSSGSYSSGTNHTAGTTTSSGSGTTNRRACSVCKFTNGKCPTCKGSGKELSTAYGTKSYIRCNSCGGTGRCKICNGTGYRP